jgi:hypothetical protein
MSVELRVLGDKSAWSACHKLTIQPQPVAGVGKEVQRKSLRDFRKLENPLEAHELIPALGRCVIRPDKVPD